MVGKSDAAEIESVARGLAVANEVYENELIFN